MKPAPLISFNGSHLLKLICLQLLLILALSGSSEAIRFFLQTGTKRCLKEEMRKSVICTGEYELSDGLGQRTDLQITDSKGHSALLRENIDKGKIAVTSDEDDIYDICFTSYAQGHGIPPREVYIDLKHGVEAKNYDEVGSPVSLSFVRDIRIKSIRMEKLTSLPHHLLSLTDRRCRQTEANGTRTDQTGGPFRVDRAGLRTYAQKRGRNERHQW